MAHILIVDDDKAIRQTLKVHFRQHGFQVSLAGTAEEGVTLAFASNVDAIVSDIRLPEKDGLWLLREIKQGRPQCPVIMITAFHDLEMTVAAMQGGATDYVPKPIDLDELDAAVKRAVDRERGAGSAALVLGGQAASSTRIVGQSFPMKEVFKSIALVAQSRITVMILGESGTGKELVARAVHDASTESKLPYIAVNCAALVENLLESELFGHERGAFTGAVSAHKGKIEQVGEGTLFLDEIAELSPAMQGKLLRILEEREYSPVGSTQIRKSKARFITATNVQLEDLVASGGFREDLYYRLNVATIHVPPLRERRTDIPLLVEFLLKKINRDLHKYIRRVSGEAMNCLQAYSWPGNVRQLENVLLKAAVMEQGDTLTTDHISPEIIYQPIRVVQPAQDDPGQAFVSLRDLERDYIVRVLNTTGWHKGKTCEILGISRPRLERRIREFELTGPAGGK